MQYFRHQLEARQLSRRLVLLFMLGVICVTLAISGVLLTLAATLSNGLIFVRLPDGPLKNVGDHSVMLALHTDVVVAITVSVFAAQ